MFGRREGDRQTLYFRLRLFSKRGKFSRISDCMTGQYEYYVIYNKNVLFAWKYQMSFDPAF